MKLMFNKRSSSGENEKNTALSKKRHDNFSELIKDVRVTWRKANVQVSESMDTAVIAGGLDMSVKAIQNKTNDLHNQITSASAAIEQIAANVNQFNGVIEKQDVALEQVTSAVEKMSASVDSVTEVTKQKMRAAGGLQNIIEKGGESVLTTAAAISEVTTAINAVSGVIKVIDDIASQTNLLAMNAAIEAAHAGEFGKGFAVVASEVRKLAESTTANSKTIDESLKKIVNQIKEAKSAGQTASDTFENIQKEVEIFVEAFMEISRSTTELSSGTAQIVTTMEDLSHVSHQISSGSKEIAIGADSVDSSLRVVKDFSNDLLDDMKVIEKKAYDISGSQSGIAQYMVDTNRSIENFFSDMQNAGQLDNENFRFNFDLIVLMHRNWLIQLRAFLDNRKEGLRASSDDHKKCDLGRWIYGDGLLFDQSNTYKKLEEEHKEFHMSAGEIIRLKTTGKKSLAEEKYQELMGNYHTVISLLETLQKE